MTDRSTGGSRDNNFFLARQPILDSDGKVAAYELLFRNSATEISGKIDPRQATGQVLCNALNAVGVASLVGTAKAFVNFDRSMLLERLAEALDPKSFVIEILEDVVADPEIASAVAALRHAGFEIALDDFLMNEQHLEKVEPILPLTSYIKLDLMGNSEEQVRDAAQFFSPGTIRLLAEKVETREQFQRCRAVGYSLFQGYFFARPEIVKGKRLDPNVQAVIRLLEILKKDPDFADVVANFKSQPELTLNLLRFINSAQFGLKRKIDSVGQAIALVGARKLRQWLMLLLFSSTCSSEGRPPILIEQATQRGHLMEVISKQVNVAEDIGEKAYLTGMFSLMDSVWGIALDTLIQQFALGEEIRAALIEKQGFLGSLLDLVLLLERGEFERSEGLRQKLGLDAKFLHDAVVSSWSFHEAANV